MNRQSFDLTILGCSSASPTSERHPSGQLLNLAERFFLIDCGEGTQMQLRRFKARFQRIDHILISHLHGDHFFGLPGLVSSMHLLGRRQDLHIYGPGELKTILDTINTISDTRLSYRIIWHFTNPLQKELIYEDQKLELHSFPLKHRIACTGFLFREKPLLRKIDKEKLAELCISVADILALKAGKDVVNEKGELIRNAEATIDPPPPRSYAYCSDTIYDPDITSHIAGVDLLYHESTFLNDQLERAAKTFHSTASQAGMIAAKSGARQLLLGHYSARYPFIEDFLAEARMEFENCLLASDGKKIKI